MRQFRSDGQDERTAGGAGQAATQSRDPVLLVINTGQPVPFCGGGFSGEGRFTLVAVSPAEAFGRSRFQATGRPAQRTPEPAVFGPPCECGRGYEVQPTSIRRRPPVSLGYGRRRAVGVVITGAGRGLGDGLVHGCGACSVITAGHCAMSRQVRHVAIRRLRSRCRGERVDIIVLPADLSPLFLIDRE